MGASGCQEVYEWYSRELHLSLLFFHHLRKYFFFLELFLSKYSQSMACENVNRYGNVLGKIIHGTVAV